MTNLVLMRRGEPGLVADAAAVASSATTARRGTSFIIVVMVISASALKQLTGLRGSAGAAKRCEAVPQQPVFLQGRAS